MHQKLTRIVILTIKVTKTRYVYCMDVETTGLYIIEFSPLPGGRESKGLEMGMEIKGGKIEKKENMEK